MIILSPILDWEKWRPIYDTNWGDKKEYQEKSKDLVEEEHPNWDDAMIETEARKQFEAAARYKN